MATATATATATVSMSKTADLNDTVVLCNRRQQLFSSHESLQRISDDTPSSPYCRFSELGSWGPCSMCTLLAEALRSSSYAGRQVLTTYDPEVLEGHVMLRFDYHLSMYDDYDDEASVISDDHSSPPTLDVFLSNEATGEVELSSQLEWYAIPDRVASALGLPKNSATQGWRTLAGFYPSGDYWTENCFTQPVLDTISECRRDHARCRAKEVPLLPSLVLDVSTSDTDGMVRLYAPHHDQRADYVALSYCWGGPQKLVATVANRTDLQRGFELSRLPRTIKEAVQVTASLGIRYIWVDALCIVQDDEASKAVEIENMGAIYGEATIALLAASGTGRSADDGFLNPYLDISVVPYFSTLAGDVVHVCLAVGTEMASPLDMRGWTYQERHLAARRLVFGGARGVSLNCSEQSLSYASGAWQQDNRHDVEDIGRAAEKRDSMTRWHEIIEEYSFRALTFAADRLPAIAGFAVDHPPVWGDEYVAGMWKSQIVDDLMWKYLFDGRGFKIPLDQYRSPGWSWVSVLDHVPNRTVGCVKNDLRRRLYVGGLEACVAYYVNHSLQLDHPGAQFGRVLSGKITLRAKMIPVKSAGTGLDMALVLKNCNYQLTGDQEDQLELLQTKECSRWSREAADEVYEEGYGSLIVLPGNEGTFHRLGTFWDWWPRMDVASETDQGHIWDKVPYREVTLI